MGCGISRTHINQLFTLLKKYEPLSFLPKDYRSLLSTVRHVETRSSEPGNYFHFGFLTGILRSLFQSLRVLPNKLNDSVNIDGIPLTKSSNSQFWPILALIRGFPEAKPFVIGIYHGKAQLSRLTITYWISWKKPFLCRQRFS